MMLNICVVGGKPIQIGGKPLHFIQGKPGQFGVLQNHAGMVTVVPQGSNPNSPVAIPTTNTATRVGNQPTTTVVTPTLVSQILQSGTTALLQPPRSSPNVTVSQGMKQVLTTQGGLGPTKIIGQAPANVVATQLAGAIKPG